MVSKCRPGRESQIASILFEQPIEIALIPIIPDLVSRIVDFPNSCGDILRTEKVNKNRM